MASGDPVLLDSVIVIDHLNGVRAATEYLAAAGSAAHISAITRAEILTGCGSDAEWARVARLLDHFNFVPIDASIANLAARLRRENRWKLPDAIQAAAALTHGLKLATRNTRDFGPEHDFVIVPYRLL